LYFRDAVKASRRFQTVHVLLIASVMLTVVSGFITYYNDQQRKNTSSLVILTYKVIQASTTLFSHLKDMETGQRGFILTGDSTFLESYFQAELDIDPQFLALQSLVSNNPRQLEVVNHHLMPTIRSKRKDMDQSLLLYGHHGQSKATEFVATRIGQAHMDSIRFWVNDLIEHERGLLETHNRHLENIYFFNDVVRFGSFGLIGFTSLIALLNLQKKQNENEHLIQALQKLNEDLEKKVRERTRQLEDEKHHVEKLNDDLHQNLEQVKSLHEGLQYANQSLVKLNDEKNDFLGIATHDLKAPIAGISALVQVMKMEGNLEPKKLNYLDHISESCDRMQRLISDLLDLNRIERGTSSIEVESADIAKLLSRIYNQYQPIAQKKNIVLKIENQVDDERICTDPDALFQILDNLISNAIKFSFPGKEVHVRVSPSGDKIRFDVTDQGQGLYREELQNLYGKFIKLSARPTAGESSSGLGLSIVKELVFLLRGEITVVSKIGEGSTFSVLIPK
jgi:signal transduction histidine kinase